MLWNRFEKDRPHIERKYRRPARAVEDGFSDYYLQTHDDYVREGAYDKSFDPYPFDPSTGLCEADIRSGLKALVEGLSGEPRAIVKARAVAYVMEHTRIEVDPRDWFGVVIDCWNTEASDETAARWMREALERDMPDDDARMRAHNSAGSMFLYVDYCHSVPHWDSVLSLGFSGLRERARGFRARRERERGLTDDERAYYDAIDIEYAAVTGLMDRLVRRARQREDADERMPHIRACLERLRGGAPSTLYEALMTTYLYHFLSEYVEGLQVRSLSNLDRLGYPYYARDIENGALNAERARELYRYFLYQYEAIAHCVGHPAYLGGTKRDGSTEINELSYLILDVYDHLGIRDPKLQLKVAPNTPDGFLLKALDMIRRGNSSIIFVSEEAARSAMRTYGATDEEMLDFAMSGCNEYSLYGLESHTGPVFINLAKLLELALNNGIDPGTGEMLGCRTGECEELETFGQLYAAYKRQLACVLSEGMRITDGFEARLREINPTPMYSATMEHSLACARDAFADGAKYNTTGVLLTGPATAADALTIVRRYVYERKLLTLTELRDILQKDWEGHEKLRMRMLHESEKFGNDLREPDALAVDICEFCAGMINLRPNSRNGFYKAGIHSSDLFIRLGISTGATPDGRRRGEQLSKNATPAVGMDRKGITAAIRSAVKLRPDLFPMNASMDFLLHPSAVRGDDGLKAMLSMIRGYMELGGSAIHGNVLDSDTLRAAQRDPDAYRTLQIRLCGWNVLFNDLNKPEQDAFIRQSEGA